MRYTVSAKGTSLPFEGVMLAEATSRGNGPRWVEFRLYKASGGQYVVERVGRSILFHREDCELVTKNRLSSVSCVDVSMHFEPCMECRPSRMEPEGLYPERERFDFQVCETPKGVIKYLEQEDRKTKLKYLTNVVRDLLADASEKDDGIYNVYVIQSLD